MSASNAEPIQVYLGFAGNNPAGPWCVCSLGVVEGVAYPHTRMVMGQRSNFDAAWAAVAFSLEHLRGRPAVLWTTLGCLAGEADGATWRASQGHRPAERAAWEECKRTGVIVRSVRIHDAPPRLAQAQAHARRGWRQWRTEEQGKVIP